MKVGIIDCGGANLNSIYYSFKRIGIDSFISNTIKDLSLADGYILPGVGSAGKVMENLNSNNLINFIQDINRDSKLGRIYIPIKDLNKFKYLSIYYYPKLNEALTRSLNLF